MLFKQQLGNQSQSGMSMIEMMMSIGIMAVIGVGARQFISSREAAEKVATAIAQAKEASTLELNALQKFILVRDTNIPSPDQFNGINLLDAGAGLHFSLDQITPNNSSVTYKFEVQSYCRPISANNTNFFDKLGGLNAGIAPISSAGQDKGECLRLLACGPGTLPAIRKRKVQVNSAGPWTEIPGLQSLKERVFEQAIGHCLRIQKLSGVTEKKVYLQMDSMVYDKKSCGQGNGLELCYKVLTETKTVSTKNTAGVKLLP